jgi:hypothetical protein
VIDMPSQQCLLAWEVPTLCVLSAGACKAGFATVRELHSGEPVHRSQITFQTWVGQSCFCSGLESNSAGFLNPMLSLAFEFENALCDHVEKFDLLCRLCYLVSWFPFIAFLEHPHKRLMPCFVTYMGGDCQTSFMLGTLAVLVLNGVM